MNETNKTENTKFNYTYSSSRREEIEKIREKYVEAAKDEKLDELRTLDNKITRQAAFAGIGIGLLGTMFLGIGLTLVLTIDNFVVGVPVGVLGIILMASTVKLHKIILKKSQKKNATRIIELTDKLLGEK